jgi:hypothetical protein
VEELHGMVDRSQLDGPTIALNFICRRVQLWKERVHPLYEYSGSGDPPQGVYKEPLMRRGELVVGAAIRPDRIPPSVKHDEGVQVDNAATSGMPKIAPCQF